MTVAIIGLGLIGGSLAIAVREKGLAGRLVGVEADPAHAALALQRALVDEVCTLPEAVAAAGLVVLALPVDATEALLPQVLDLARQQVVMDVGSTKARILESVGQHARRGRFVASHPMWGTEYSGPAAAVPGAFAGKAAVICNAAGSDPDALLQVEALYRALGMHLVYMEAAAHDAHVAYVSHISHITSFALANTVLEKEKEEEAIFELASGGFESTVRLAKSNAAMWVPVLLENRGNVLEVLGEHLRQLERFRELLLCADAGGLRRLIEQANTIRRIIR